MLKLYGVQIGSLWEKNLLGWKVAKKCRALLSSENHPWKHAEAGLNSNTLERVNKYSDCRSQVRHYRYVCGGGGAGIKQMSRISVDERNRGGRSERTEKVNDHMTPKVPI